MMRRCTFPAVAGIQAIPGIFTVAQSLRCFSSAAPSSSSLAATRAACSTSHGQAPFAFSRLRGVNANPNSATTASQRRHFLFRPKNQDASKVKVDEALFDKTYSHWNGKLFGVPMDKVIYYLKINGGVATVCVIVYMFFAGYVYLTQFSLATVGKLGFMAGFWTSFTLYSMFLLFKRQYQIAPNAVYNQAISIVMKNQKVIDHLGSSPRTGDFRAYCASGGFKLPLLRRLRSGQYGIADALGTKPRKLQMMFLLQSPTGGQEALVSCEVKKQTNAMFGNGYYFQSLSLHMTAPKKDPKDLVLIGGEKDIVFKGLLFRDVVKNNTDKE